MELEGKVKRVSEIQTFESGFQKRELVLIVGETYPQPVAIDFLKEKIDLIDGLKEGDAVKVFINIGGREWTSPSGNINYFNSITGWKIKRPIVYGTKTEKPKKGGLVNDEEDDLPF